MKMKQLSAFMQMNAMNNNTPGVDSPIGELSRLATTYSRELGHYGSKDYPEVKLTSFDCRDENNLAVKLDSEDTEVILNLGQWLYDESITGSLSNNKTDCEQKINAEMSSAITVLSVGDMMTNGTYWLPTYVFFKIENGTDNVSRVWFSDVAFRAQYDIYEIVVVPPVDPLDDLHKDRATVTALLGAITIPDHLRKAEELTVNFPETYLESSNYDWVDRNDSTVVVHTPWTVAIYGAAGNNADVIRQALIDYILANSSYDRDAWEVIYPDLFRPTEFYIAPLWDRYSLPNQVKTAGLFSPVVPYRDIMSYGVQLIADTDVDYMSENMVVAAIYLKGLMFLAVGNPRNREDAYRFDELWPEYLNLPTTDADFNRIPPETQEFIRKLVGMCVIAENMTDYSEIPTGMTRVQRSGIKYLASTFDKVMYLVALKDNTLVIPLELPPTE